MSYSHQDGDWLKRLQVHLKPLVRQGAFELWDDTRIDPGADWRAEIERALARAKVAVLLVSADFLASDFIADNELPPLLAAAEQRGVRILSVILGHCLFAEHPELSRFQAVNSPNLPLSGMQKAEAEAILLKAARAIAKAVEPLKAEAMTEAETAAAESFNSGVVIDDNVETFRVFFVREKTGAKISLAVPRHMRVRDIKQRIIREFSVETEFDGRTVPWELICNGRILDDSVTAEESQMADGDTLQLYFREFRSK